MSTNTATVAAAAAVLTDSPVIKLGAHLVHAQVLHRTVQLFPAGSNGLLLLDRRHSTLKLFPGVVLEVVG